VVEIGAGGARPLEDVQASPHDSDQLELELAGLGRAWVEPWEGMSPRVLTGAFRKFSLGAPPAGGLHADAGLSAQRMIAPAASQLEFPFMLEV